MKKTISILATGSLCAACLLQSCNSGNEYDATGIFETTTVTVSAEEAGKIMSLDIAEGDSIAGGFTIGLIDTTLLSLQASQLASQEASVLNSQPDVAKQIESLRRQIAVQQTECDRIENLLKDGAATPQQADNANGNLRVLNGQLEALISTLTKNRSSLSENSKALSYQIDQINTRIKKCRISSPITGVVLTKYAEPGEYATVGRKLFKVADMDNVWLRAYFTSDRLASLKLGDTVKVTADYGDDNRFEYPGKIIWIAQESEFTPKSIQTSDTRSDLVYAVKIAVKNDGRIKLGMYGEVKL